MTTHTKLRILVACASPILSGASLAQDSTKPQTPSHDELEPAAEASSFDLSLSVYSWSLLPADLEDAPGDVYTAHTGLEVDFDAPLTEQLTLNLNLAFEHSSFDFSSADPFTGSATSIPDDFVRLGLRAILDYTLNDQWSLVGGGLIGFAMDPDADLGDAIIGGGMFGAGYAPSKDFKITLGLAVQSRIEDDPLVTPLILLYYRINEQSHIQSTNLPQGFGLSIITKPLDEVEFEIFGGWQYRQWRLDGGPAVARDGVLRDSLIVLGAGIAWIPTPRLELRLRAGVVVFRELELLSAGGRDISDLDANAGAFIGVRLAYRF